MAKEKDLMPFEDRKESNWSFIKYLKGTAKYKWWVIGTTVVFAAIGFVGFKFGINQAKRKLTATYSFNLAGAYEDEDTIRLVDGTTFSTYDLTNYSNLQKVKESSDEYSRVDIDDIVANEGISITKDVVENINTQTVEESKDSSIKKMTANITYTLEAKASCFPNDKIGKKFLYDLVTLPTTLSTEAIKKYNADMVLSDNFKSLSFEKQVDQLETQFTSDLNVYTTLATMFGNSAYVDEDGTRINEAQNSFVNKYYASGSQVFYKELRGSLYANQYVDYTPGQEAEKVAELHASCKSYIDSIARDENQIKVLEENLTQLTNIKTMYSDNEVLIQQIFLLNQQIGDLKNEVFNLAKELNKNGYFICEDSADPNYGKYVFDEDYVDSTIYKLTHLTTAWEEGCVNFKASIEKYRKSLVKDNETTTDVLQYCYSIYQNRVNILNGGYIASKGGIPSFLGIIAGAVVGFVASSLIAASLYIYKEKEEPTKEAK